MWGAPIPWRRAGLGWRRAPALGAVGLVIGLAGVAPGARQGPQQPLFRSGTELVQVDAIVQDGDDKFVSGLAADDFEVREDGKAQSIQLFYLVTGPSSLVPRAVVPDGTLRAPDQTARRLFTLVFDQDHLSFEAFRNVQKASIGFLQEHFRPGDIGGVVLEGTMANGRLTTVRRELLDAIAQARPHPEVRDRVSVFREWPRLEGEFEALRIDAGDDRTLADAVIRNCQERLGECLRPGVSEQVENELQWNARRYLSEARIAATRFVQTLSAVTTGLGRMEGRKTVVVFTEGFLADDARGMLAQIAARAARFGVAIYAIDARGLARAATGMTDASDPGPRLQPSAFDSYDEGPNILTAETGGYVVRNSNDFLGALSRIAEDTSTYYVLGYSPENATLDGKFRKIEVRVKWKGMKVRSRKGYLATPLPPPARIRRATTAAATPAPEVQPRPPAALPDATVEMPPETIGLRTFDHLVTAMLVRPDADTRRRELMSLDPSASVSPGESPPAGATPSAAEQGWEKYLNGDLESAQRELAGAAADARASAWVYYALGLAEFGLGHHPEASVAFEKVRASEPDFDPVYFDLADAYLQMDEARKAAAVLRAASDQWPRNTDAWNALGVALVHQGDLDAAIASFQKASQVDPRDGLAFFNLGRAYEERYARSRRLDPESPLTPASERDRLAAQTNYEKYVTMGGAYEAEARAALTALGRAK